ncbi:platelet endothelial aggregation receptor 1-like isoform X2 [Saccostrea cucullata]|uniref:platelet endothelial aggregation receptor 1-like isoform X2 n=1 Tax=Saccostrea cuccullata TaxID=36930 RepID=UPI002ED0E4F0
MKPDGFCCEYFDRSLDFEFILIMKLWILACLCSLNSLMVFCENVYGYGVCVNELLDIRSCCKDFKPVGNMCVECDPGYRGYNCSETCPPNHYGPKCFKTCDCLPYQYCDTEKGCLCNTTSVNCTDQEPETVETSLGTTISFYILSITLSSTISVVLLLAAGVTCISFWMKKRLREAKKERYTLGDQQLLHVEDTSPGTNPQPHQTEDIYAHTTSGIYHHLSLRVQLSSLSDSDKNIENPSHCPGLSPDTISEQSEERIQTKEKESQTDIHTDSEHSEEVYFDVSYAIQNAVDLQKDESFERKCSLKSETDVEDGEYCDVKYSRQHSKVVYGNEFPRQQISSNSELDFDKDGLADYVNCINIYHINESVGDVYSSVQKTSKKTKF